MNPKRELNVPADFHEVTVDQFILGIEQSGSTVDVDSLRSLMVTNGLSPAYVIAWADSGRPFNWLVGRNSRKLALYINGVHLNTGLAQEAIYFRKLLSVLEYTLRQDIMKPYPVELRDLINRKHITSIRR